VCRLAVVVVLSLAACGGEDPVEGGLLPTFDLQPYTGLEAFATGGFGAIWESAMGQDPFAVTDESLEAFEAFLASSPEIGGDGAARGIAALRPALAFGNQMRWMYVPAMLSRLGEMREADAWTPKERDIALAVLRSIEKLPGAPTVALGDTREEHRRALDVVWTWFSEQIRRPECLAAMFDTIEDGPAVGLESTGALPDVPKGTVSLAKGLRLDLHQGVETKGQAVLRLSRDGRQLWHRVICHVDGSPMPDLRLTSSPITENGPFGWTANLSYGERVRVFVHPEGRFLFYFYSW
jgi:hypothetical protein